MLWLEIIKVVDRPGKAFGRFEFPRDEGLLDHHGRQVRQFDYGCLKFLEIS
jgi:hypothetical protein